MLVSGAQPHANCAVPPLQSSNFTMMTILDALHAVVEHRSLREDEAEDVMRSILAGESTAALTASLLTALRMKGETVGELAGFARAMRAAAHSVPVRDEFRPLLDTCGTGGAGISTFNVSTAAAFVAAGGGLRVAKHGNRSISSQCGSADVLEALGVKTHLNPEAVGSAIENVGIGFLFAPAFHGAMRHVQPVRLELKIRSVFNYLGPLTNPAEAEIQVMGTGSAAMAEKLAGALVRLGLRRGFVVCGSDGLGEVTVSGPSTVFSIIRGEIEESVVSPADFGFDEHPLASIHGGDPVINRRIVEAVLRGERGAPREVVLMNAALAFVAAGHAQDFREGVAIGEKSIDSGAALGKLDALRLHSQAAALK